MWSEEGMDWILLSSVYGYGTIPSDEKDQTVEWKGAEEGNWNYGHGNFKMALLF